LRHSKSPEHRDLFRVIKDSDDEDIKKALRNDDKVALLGALSRTNDPSVIENLKIVGRLEDLIK